MIVVYTDVLQFSIFVKDTWEIGVEGYEAYYTAFVTSAMNYLQEKEWKT